MNLVISSTAIRTDAEGRYCLNDLHTAAIKEGANNRTKEPGKFMSSPQTIGLIEEIESTQNLGSLAVSTVMGRNGGTYVCKELVYAYAMWVSPKFHLQVIRAYDAMTVKPEQPPANLSRLQLIELAMQAEQERLVLEEKATALEAKVTEQAPKIEALERFADQDGKHGVRTAAKLLGLPERRLISWLLTHDWYYRDHSARLCAKASKIASGYLDTVPIEIPRSDGIQTVAQPVVTQRGLAKLGELLAKDGMLPKVAEASDGAGRAHLPAVGGNHPNHNQGARP